MNKNKKRYNQIKDKKKKCPRCTNLIFNATIKCTGFINTYTKCKYIHPSKKNDENNRIKQNKLSLSKQINIINLKLSKTISLNDNSKKYNYSLNIRKKDYKTNIWFKKSTKQIRKILFNQEWEDNIFDNLTEIEKI